MAPCMSETIACRLFLQTSGKWPSSLTMPPRWPPMPSAQVLQAFLERMARHSLRMPPASRAFFQVYQTAGQPPPALSFLIAICYHAKALRRKGRKTNVINHKGHEELKERRL